MGELEIIKKLLEVNFTSIKKDINTLISEINDLKIENSILKKKISSLEKQKKSKLNTEFVSKIEKNKKIIVKQKILEFVDLKKPIPEIKELIVDLLNYCSKASFYRYIDELKRDGKINTININETEVYI